MRLLAALIAALLLAGCTTFEVRTHIRDTTGVVIPWDDAVAITDYINSQDCLPQYDAEQYVECAIVDSWHAYNIRTSLDGWARIAYCESRLDPHAANPRSSARGLYQNLLRYWPERAAAAGFPGGDIYNARVHAFVSGWLAENHGLGHWVCRP